MKHLTAGEVCEMEYVQERIIDVTRWEVIREVVVEIDGHFYRGSYRRGATECQETD